MSIIIRRTPALAAQPETLEEVIATYGNRYFKLKVGGDVDADLERLTRIAAVLDRRSDRYWATLDGNEQYGDVEGIAALCYLVLHSRTLARQLNKRVAVDATAVYWHFMDGLWIYILVLLAVRF